MSTIENMKCGKLDATGVQQGISEALLRSEIGFWREMIESCQETDPPDSIERMRYALALAESKLARPPPNIYHLDDARGDYK
jgi:hypothetical protein